MTMIQDDKIQLSAANSQKKSTDDPMFSFNIEDKVLMDQMRITQLRGSFYYPLHGFCRLQ